MPDSLDEANAAVPELKTAMQEVKRTFNALTAARAKFNRCSKPASREAARVAMVDAEGAYRTASDRRDELVEIRNARMTQRGDERGELWSRPDGAKGEALGHLVVSDSGLGPVQRVRHRSGGPLDEHNDVQMYEQATHIAKGGWGEASVLARAYLLRVPKPLPTVTRRADGACTTGPPPDVRSVDEHLDELASGVKRALVIEDPAPPADFEALRVMTSAQLHALGCGGWGEGGLMLFPASWFDSIPEGYVVTSITGRRHAFSADLSRDQRFGYLAYGVTVPAGSR